MSERCQKCGKTYYEELGQTWWEAGPLWREVYGTSAGLRCPACFTQDCVAKGIFIYWRPVIDRRR